MSNLDIDQPIIVKKVKKGGHAHHGGAWKVAYADFVTAMMAFFLLLWLLNATTEEQKSGLADYFSPASVSSPASGAGGVLGGKTISVEGNRVSAGGPSEGGVTLPIPPDLRTPTEEQGAETDPEKTEPKTAAELSQDQVAELLAKREQEKFDAAEEALLDAIESSPELEALQDNLLIEQTPDGLRIQLIDKNGTSMFASGSATPNEQLIKLIGLVSGVITQMPNKISISGHTDSTPYRHNDGYGNWELSSDRANAARRLLIGAGVDLERIADVQGRAATEPLLPEDTTDPANRRISIVLLRENKLSAPEIVGDTKAKTGKRQPEPHVLPAPKPAEPGNDARIRHLQRQG